MSSEPKGLHNLDYVPQYERVLADNLPKNFTQFADFFAGTQRLHTLGAMLSDHISQTGLKVLNVGSGPFATEIFVKALADQSIVALDYTPEFSPFHSLFRKDGHLQYTEFLQTDVMAQDFPEAAFDLIILHDILYEPALYMNDVITHLSTCLKPGGLLFFDFVNSRTRWIWAMLGKPDRFKRYDPTSVKIFLDASNFEVVDWRPTHGAKSLSVRLLHASLSLFGVSNNHAVLVRYKGT